MEKTQQTPNCVGVILDGNRRWAKQRGMSSFEGHKNGYENLKKLSQWCRDASIEHLVVYAFSTENWKRTDEEVGYLMDMLRDELKKYFKELRTDDAAVHLVGNLALFSFDIQDMIRKLHDTNPTNPTYHLWIAMSYGGRAEIVTGVNKLLQKNITQVTEEEFTQVLWTVGMPDPDLIIRTGGERRLSNFLTWGSVYAELFFVDTFWPAFTKEEFNDVLKLFSERKRRYGV